MGSKAIVKFRDVENALEYPIEMVMPFGSQCVALKDGNSTLIFPVARLTEIVLVEEEGSDTEVVIEGG